MKILAVGAELFHAEGEKDRYDELIVAIRNFAKASREGGISTITNLKMVPTISFFSPLKSDFL
jgi:hypothetical protein